jgi:hypothetical protein
MRKLTKDTCIPGTKAIVSDTRSKWNENTGAEDNGLLCFLFKTVEIGSEIELSPGTEITIQSKPRRFNENGNQVKFTIDNDPNVYMAWWICFKAKVVLI